MFNSAKQILTRFFTFKVATGMLMGIGNLLSPFSKVSNKPLLPKSQFPWAAMLESYAKQIREEVINLLQSQRELPNIQEIQPAEALLSKDNKWKTFFLFGFGHKAYKNMKLCPATTQALSQIPDLLTAFFSILLPGKHIPAHRGIFKGIVRTHLGLIIPKEADKCTMRVNHEIIHWQEGTSIFLTTHTSMKCGIIQMKIRVVLLIDTKKALHEICSQD